MCAFLDISNELIFETLIYVDAADLASLLRTCQTLHHFVKGNKLLHKEIYLSRYDDPSHLGEPDWENELQQNEKLERLLQTNDLDLKRNNIDFVAGRIRRLINTTDVDPSRRRNIDLLTDYFDLDTRSDDNKRIFLCSSGLFDQGGTRRESPAATPKLRQLSAQLHCLWGRPVDPVPYTRRISSRFGRIGLPRDHFIHADDDTPARNTRQQTEDIPVHMVARGKVYDLSEYTDNSLWGPFKGDGSHEVDWEKMEAVMVVLGFNLARFTERSDGRFPYVWDSPWEGAFPNSFRSPEAPAEASDSDEHSASAFFDQLMGDFDSDHTRLMKQPDPALEALDPYGVTGTWMRVVCFLDYNDLYHFNFHHEFGPMDDVGDGRLQRRPIDTDEGIITLSERVSRCFLLCTSVLILWWTAIRLIRIKLRVTKIEAPADEECEDGDDKPDPDFRSFQGERLPVVHFTGDSRSLHASWDPNANSKIRGSVRQTPQGEIRWTTFSIFHGEERWRSEGIQVGGLRSARGVLGNWFDKDFDEHGPAGPTAFWKESDWLEDGRREGRDGRVVAFF